MRTSDMQTYVTRRFEFSASHRYWNSAWDEARNRAAFGKTISPYGHGHNYVLEVTVTGPVDPDTGMVVNMSELKRIVGNILEAEFDHMYLNEDTPYFRDQQPTTENIVRVLWRLIAPALPEGVELARLRLYEDPTLYAETFGEGETHLGRLYGFSAAHRLNSPRLSEAENRAVYGKGNNLHGHGHDYTLEVEVTGPVAGDTGMVMDLAELDAQVQQVIENLDHRHLDREVAAFADQVSTGENIVQYLWTELSANPGNRLWRLRLWETPSNTFEVSERKPHEKVSDPGGAGA